jgi:hypothetical protein
VSLFKGSEVCVTDVIVLGRDVWESSWIQQVCDSVTWHVFKTPPTKVYVSVLL